MQEADSEPTRPRRLLHVDQILLVYIRPWQRGLQGCILGKCRQFVVVRADVRNKTGVKNDESLRFVLIWGVHGG
jgi:hypothetical protein